MGLINAVGNLGGYFGPILLALVGYIRQHSKNPDDYYSAFMVLALSLVLSGLAALLLPKRAGIGNLDGDAALRKIVPRDQSPLEPPPTAKGVQPRNEQIYSQIPDVTLMSNPDLAGTLNDWPAA